MKRVVAHAKLAAAQRFTCPISYPSIGPSDVDAMGRGPLHVKTTTAILAGAPPQSPSFIFHRASQISYGMYQSFVILCNTGMPAQ
jgi:hypothetical protein